MSQSTCSKCPLKKVCKNLPADMTCDEVRAYVEAGEQAEDTR